MENPPPGSAPPALSNRPANRLDTIGLVAFVSAALVMTLIHLAGLDQSWSTESILILLWVGVFGGWNLRLSTALLLTAITCLAWWWIDAIHTTESLGSILRHALRSIIVLSSVLLTCRARQSLDDARKNARIDSLTGLPNRRALIEARDAELRRLKRFQRSFSVAMIDCDGFKSINDQQGHLVGDRALQLIGTALRQQRRAYDSIGRWGGDEFVLILPETMVDDTPIVIERLRAHLRQVLQQQYPLLAFSIGVVTIQTPQDSTIEMPDATACLHAADQLMYAAKRSGKDQTRFSLLENLKPTE